MVTHASYRVNMFIMNILLHRENSIDVVCSGKTSLHKVQIDKVNTLRHCLIVFKI